MSADLPTVIIPYEGPPDSAVCRDIFVYLRPETNGVLVESTLLKVIQSTPLYKSHIQLVYLANIPGSFLATNRIVEDHYRYKLPFAIHGGRQFTPEMERRFTEHFLASFDAVDIVGAFEALRILQISADELFNKWVSTADVLILHCQTIKKIDGLYVVNYDMPALLHKNNAHTDIAVMIFRSTLEDGDFHQMIHRMAEELRKQGILGSNRSVGRAFHYSKGPFGQLLDARGYLYDQRGDHIPESELQFCRYLEKRGITSREITGALDNPIMVFRTEEGRIEECLFPYTIDNTFEQAYRKISSCILQYWIRIPENYDIY